MADARCKYCREVLVVIPMRAGELRLCPVCDKALAMPALKATA